MITVIGADTGDTFGLLLAGWDRGQKRAAHVHAYQCDGRSAAGLLRMILAVTDHVTAAQIEAFDDRPGRRGLRGTNPRVIRAQVTILSGICGEHGIPVYARQVSDVKGWATEERLKAAGLSDLVSPPAMIHARSAAWHALYCAVRDCGVPDPLSRMTRKQEASS